MEIYDFSFLLFLRKNKNSRKTKNNQGLSAVLLAPPARIELTTNP